MDLLIGNAEDTDTQGTGWFIGFSPWARQQGCELLVVPERRPVTGLCVKWFSHPAGHDSGDGKPQSEGHTVSLLTNAGGRFRIELSPHPGFEGPAVRRVLLSRPGDYAAWGAGLFHRWHCEHAATVLTIRWQP